MVHLRDREPQTPMAGGQSLQEFKPSDLEGWGSKGLPDQKEQLFTKFYVFWVLPSGSFLQLNEAQTHFCHS